MVTGGALEEPASPGIPENSTSFQFGHNCSQFRLLPTASFTLSLESAPALLIPYIPEMTIIIAITTTVTAIIFDFWLYLRRFLKFFPPALLFTYNVYAFGQKDITTRETVYGQDLVQV